MRSSVSHFLRLVHSVSRIGNESCRVFLGINNIILANLKLKTIDENCYLLPARLGWNLTIFRNCSSKRPNMLLKSIKSKQGYHCSKLKCRDIGTFLFVRDHQAKEGQHMQGRVNQQISSSEGIIPSLALVLGLCRIGVVANEDLLSICHTGF